MAFLYLWEVSRQRQSPSKAFKSKSHKPGALHLEMLMSSLCVYGGSCAPELTGHLPLLQRGSVSKQGLSPGLSCVFHAIQLLSNVSFLRKAKGTNGWGSSLG